MSSTIKEHDADVVVIGGGSAGVGAAVSAARKGLQVYLIEPTDLLGGIVAKTLGMPVDGAYPKGKSVGGLCEEWLESLYQNDPPAALRRPCLLPGFEDGLAREVMYDPDIAVHKLFEMVENAGVHLLLNATAVDVAKEENKVKSVTYYDRQGAHTLNAKVVIDTSGDGDIADKAEIPFEKGDEKGDMMGATLTFLMQNVDQNKAFDGVEDPFRRELVKQGIEENRLDEDMYNIYMMPGFRPDTVYFNSIHIKGIDGTNPKEVQEGTIEARKRAYELIKFVKEEVPGFENAELEQMAPTLGIRETRRMEGMYTLTKDDVMDGAKFEDGVVCCDCTIDDVVRGEGKDSKVIHVSLIDRGVYYQVPYRSLCPKEVENVLFAGRCFSAETEAFASARGISTSMIMGQACGTAAYLAIKHDTPVQDIDYKELTNDLSAQGVNGVGQNEL
ncbi:FAD-dependent oxidoreductase [Thalassobacillus sp. CUG 92003]|uniref:FAD-dependent oxidoreductase n=1 Tax=Thalassobacillus sp. CUG 92003 TaxID=2736641 RepID=UPI0015E680BD|nr:FAD-dependent oxidoreductase [Thalassobacillus sp. CUG 92003]